MLDVTESPVHTPDDTVPRTPAQSPPFCHMIPDSVTERTISRVSQALQKALKDVIVPKNILVALPNDTARSLRPWPSNLPIK